MSTDLSHNEAEVTVLLYRATSSGNYTIKATVAGETLAVTFSPEVVAAEPHEAMLREVTTWSWKTGKLVSVRSKYVHIYLYHGG